MPRTTCDGPCPDTGTDAHNHPANPCPKCEGTGRVQTRQALPEKVRKCQNAAHRSLDWIVCPECGFDPETQSVVTADRGQKNE